MGEPTIREQIDLLKDEVKELRQSPAGPERTERLNECMAELKRLQLLDPHELERLRADGIEIER